VEAATVKDLGTRFERDLVQIGVTSLSVSEATGGAGADLRAATVVLLALGSLGASVPVVETGLMAGRLMERAGARLRGGIVTAAAGDGLQVHSDDGGWIVSGTLTRVPWARHADYAGWARSSPGRTD
jgi:acyl-CoA dehydrogenase